MCKDRLERYGLVAACIRRNYLILLSFRKWNVYEYVKLEFQGPTGPLNSSSCGDLALFAHERLLHIFEEMFAPPLIVKCLSPL